MPGKCKFQDSWLSREIYKDWLVKEVHDIHFARCRACCKSIKLQTMGEAALTSHSAGAGHKAAVRKLVEGGNVMLINAAGQINGSVNRTEDSKEQVAICLQRDALDRIPGSDWADQHHIPTSHNAELQDATFPAAYFTAPGTSRLISQRLLPTGGEGGGRDPPLDSAGPHRYVPTGAPAEGRGSGAAAADEDPGVAEQDEGAGVGAGAGEGEEESSAAGGEGLQDEEGVLQSQAKEDGRGRSTIFLQQQRRRGENF
ncbi:hypothetical protein OYC64_000269 [Pagothenia borchgrevinki]|uniref:Uncharacterized protein n=1 Tax=Pagothenia borchgrevinki TaxID=8213 RepID=A0ABD2HCX3_PAGBO